MSSLIECAGTDGCTVTNDGDDATSDTETKSRKGSYGTRGIRNWFVTNGIVLMRSVYPSGGAFITTSVPITPDAPDRLSTTIDCPIDSVSFAASSRPTTSTLPPGGNGETSRIGFAG